MRFNALVLRVAGLKDWRWLVDNIQTIGMLFVAFCPSNSLVYLRDGSAQTILRAATLR